MKYRILPEISMDYKSLATLFRIQALVDIPEHGVIKGEMGGWVDGDDALSQIGSCWIADESKVFDSKVEDNVLIKGESIISDDAIIEGDGVIENSTIARCQLFGEHHIKDSNMFDAYLGMRSTIENSTLQHIEAESSDVELFVQSSRIESKEKVRCGNGMHVFDNVRLFSSHSEFIGMNTLINVTVDTKVVRFRCIGIKRDNHVENVHFYVSQHVSIEDSVLEGSSESSRINISGKNIGLIETVIRDKVVIEASIMLTQVNLLKYARIHALHGHITMTSSMMTDFSSVEMKRDGYKTIQQEQLSGDSLLVF